MRKETPNVPLPNLGRVIEWSRGEMPPHESLVLFFEVWWSMRTQPGLDEYQLLYIALSEILPKVEWPKEQFKWWCNKYDSALITKYETFKRKYLDRFGPIFDVGVLIKKYEDNGVEGVKNHIDDSKVIEDMLDKGMSNNEIKSATKKSLRTIQRARKAWIDARHESDKQNEHKLLIVGANQHTACDNNNVLVDRGTSPEYIKARLIRDGHQELADKVKAKKLSARKAAIAVGYINPKEKTPLTELKRVWVKANEAERNEFLSWVSSNCSSEK